MEKEKLYSVGQVSELVGISTQALRYYDKIGLLPPAYINPETGYRYYSYIQLSLIDRIRYLQNLGLSLEEIKLAFDRGDSQSLLAALQKRLKAQEEQLALLQENIETLQWYINYFQYPDQQRFYSIPYKRYMPERYILMTPSLPEEREIRSSDHASQASLALHKLKNAPEFKELSYLRQNGNIIDFDSMLGQEWNSKYYFVHLKNHPGFSHPNIMTIPAGVYLCFQGRPLVNDWDTSLIRKLFDSSVEQEKPSLVIADEYENSLTDFISCVYEIQMLLWPVTEEQDHARIQAENPFLQASPSLKIHKVN